MPQCVATTLSGNRCTRNARPGDVYCTQHAKMYEGTNRAMPEAKNEQKMNNYIPKNSVINYQNASKTTIIPPKNQPINPKNQSRISPRNQPIILPLVDNSVMKITSVEVDKLIKTAETTTNDYSELARITYANEAKFVSAAPTYCAENDYKINIEDGNQLYTVLHKDFYDYDTLEGILCATNTFLRSKDLHETSQKIHKWFSGLRLIGQGANGYVMDATITGKQSIFAIKANFDPVDTPDLTHELFVGLYGTNTLREVIPNFAYVFGGFKCSKPEIPKSGKIVTNYCNPDKPVQYILYEFVPGVTFADFIEISGRKEFLECIIQITFSLQVALDKIDFTHYDFKPDNVIVRIPYTETFYIQYAIGNRIFYVKTNLVPTIIDYGYSHIKYLGKNYGANHLYEFAIRGDTSFGIGDLYRLILTSIRWAKKNLIIAELLFDLYEFFSSENLVQSYLKQVSAPNRYGILPYTKEWNKYKPIDFYDYISTIIDLKDIVFQYEDLPKDAKILQTNSHHFNLVNLS